MPKRNSHPEPDSITGLQAHLGHGAPEAKGFWADAWTQVLTRRAAVIALVWVGVVAFFAVASPLVASGHPLILWELDEAGQSINRSYPLFQFLSSVDWLLIIGSILGLVVLVIPSGATRSERLGLILAFAMQAGIIAIIAHLVGSYFGARDAPQWARDLEQGNYRFWSKDAFVPVASALIALSISAAFLIIPFTISLIRRIGAVAIVGTIAAVVVWCTWSLPPERFEYAQRLRDGEIKALWTLVPWSPAERPSDRDAKLLPPGTSTDQALKRRVTVDLPVTEPLTQTDFDRVFSRIDDLPLPRQQRSGLRATVTAWLNDRAELESPTGPELRKFLHEQLAGSGRIYLLGSDFYGQDVLSQLLHACRLAISIGLVSTSIALFIGITVGALMGYFGGIVDLVLYRIVEIFMAIPLLFILIVAAGVFQPSTYGTMAIIGCFIWPTTARFTRAEFLKLRNQDFVQAARGVGLPLRSILFRHMLPNGVTPVLVEGSFIVAFAIILEATLSYLGLGPADQASWGRLLADATNEVGAFLWWLAIFPGVAIFLAALSYNLIGEALRDAIDPKLKKARV